MKKTILAAAFVAPSTGTAFAGSDGDHGADRPLNQTRWQSMFMAKSADKLLAEDGLTGDGHRTDGVPPRGSLQ